jgi:hypothetical protein
MKFTVFDFNLDEEGTAEFKKSAKEKYKWKITGMRYSTDGRGWRGRGRWVLAEIIWKSFRKPNEVSNFGLNPFGTLNISTKFSSRKCLLLLSAANNITVIYNLSPKGWQLPNTFGSLVAW